jgi:membrane protease YdiL (CAAX protease family)
MIGILTGVAVVGLGTFTLWFIGDLKFLGAGFEPAVFLLNLLIFGLVAFGEELFFRGYLLNNLLQSLNKWLALGISAVFFMLLHLQNAGASASLLPVLSVFTGGVLFGIAYVFTKNLWFGIALHFTWNFLQGPVLGYDVSGTSARPIFHQTITGSPVITGGVFGFEGSAVCILLSVIAIAVLISIFRMNFR